MPRLAVRDFVGDLSFNGASSYVNLTQTLNLPLITNSAYTIMGWFKLVQIASSGVYVIFGEGNTASANQLVEFSVIQDVGRSGKFRMQIRNDSGISQLSNKYSVNRIIPNRWYHFALTDNNGDIHLYINGVEDANTINNSWDYTRSTYTFNRTVLGALIRNVTSNYFNGYMDEIRLYNSALSETQVLDTYVTGLEQSASNLIGYYKLNEGSGTTATDSSGSNNTGTITNGTYSTDIVMPARTVI